MSIDINGKGILINSIVHLFGNEVKEMIKDGAVLVDLREEFETNARQFDLAPVLYIPNTELKDYYEALPKDRLLILADSVGLRSKEAILFLKEKGFSNLANLAGGIVDWERAGFNVIKDPKEMFHGQCACMLKRKNKK